MCVHTCALIEFLYPLKSTTCFAKQLMELESINNQKVCILFVQEFCVYLPVTGKHDYFDYLIGSLVLFIVFR